MRKLNEQNQLTKTNYNKDKFPCGVECESCGTEMWHESYGTSCKVEGGKYQAKRVFCPKCRKVGLLYVK